MEDRTHRERWDTYLTMRWDALRSQMVGVTTHVRYFCGDKIAWVEVVERYGQAWFGGLPASGQPGAKPELVKAAYDRYVP